MGAQTKIKTTAFAASSTAWAAMVPDGSFDLTIAARTGDWVEVGFSGLGPAAAVHGYLDVAVMVGATVVNWVSTATSSHANGGSGGLPGSYTPSFYRPSTSVGVSALYKVRAADIVAGNVTFRMYATGHIAATWTASSTDPAAFWVNTRLVGSGPLPPDTTSYVGWGVPALITPPPAAIPLAASFLWLRAKDSLAVGAGGSVSAPVDFSPSANTVSTVTGAPTLLLNATPKLGPVFNFGGGQSFRIPSVAGLPTGDGEVWMVVRTDATSATTSDGCWTFSNSGNASHFTYASTIYENIGTNGRYSFNSPVSLNSYRIYRIRVAGAAWTAYIDGTAVSIQAGNTPNWRASDVYIGLSAQAGYYFHGQIAELIGFNRALTSQEAIDTTAYLTTEHL